MSSWLKSRKKTSPKSNDTKQLIKSPGCLKNFNFCFNQTNMIDCEAISDESEDHQPNANTSLTTKTFTDDMDRKKSTESRSKNKSRGSDAVKKNATYSIKCKKFYFVLVEGIRSGLGRVKFQRRWKGCITFL